MATRLRSRVREHDELRVLFEKFLAPGYRGPARTEEDYGSLTQEELDRFRIDEHIKTVSEWLKRTGVGDFVVGRRGHPSRFVWAYDVRDIAKEALGLDEPEEGPEEGNDDGAEVERLAAPPTGPEDHPSRTPQSPPPVRLPLSPEREALLILPAGLQKQEADIITAYVQAQVRQT